MRRLVTKFFYVIIFILLSLYSIVGLKIIPSLYPYQELFFMFFIITVLVYKQYLLYQDHRNNIINHSLIIRVRKIIVAVFDGFSFFIVLINTIDLLEVITLPMAVKESLLHVLLFSLVISSIVDKSTQKKIQNTEKKEEQIVSIENSDQ